MAMFGGDDVGAVIIDVGTHTTKAGFAGEDTPRCVIPSTVGTVFQKGSGQNVGAGPMDLGDGSAPQPEAGDRTFYVGPKASLRRDHMEMRSPMQEGLIHDWDVVEKIWDHIFKEAFVMNAKEHPVLLTESSYNTPAIREKATEILFERHEVPALFLGKNAVMSAFASGKANALVIEAGAGMTLATPVHDGYVLQKSIAKSHFAGDELTNLLRAIIADGGNSNIRPHYSFTKKQVGDDEWQVTEKDFPHTTASFREFAVKSIIEDIKHTSCKAVMSFNQTDLEKRPDDGYSLPDGTVVFLGTNRFRLPEYYLRPETIPHKFRTPGTTGCPSIAKLVAEAISTCDADLRKEMFRNIVLSGGSSLFPSFSERLTQEIGDQAPTQLRKDVKVIAPTHPVERKFSVFIGGSILGSLGTFHQMWMSKGEYEEHGKALVDRKCP